MCYKAKLYSICSSQSHDVFLHASDCHVLSDFAFRYIFLLRSCRPMDVFIISSLPPNVVERLLTAWFLHSPDITPVLSYYEPFRHPLIFDSLPAVHGYRIYLAPKISFRDEEGFSSCLVCPCCRAIATTPPE